MKWSLLAGRFWGTEIRLHASLLLLIPYALVTFQPASFADALRVLLLITAIFFCVALHELGHTIAARMYGIQVKSIVLWPLGGFANLSRRPANLLHDLVISAAGPLANLLIFSFLAILAVLERLMENAGIFPELSRWLWNERIFALLVGLAIANLALVLFNLVPIFPLDGGQIARNLLKLAFGEKRADTIMILLSLPLAIALTVFGVTSGDVVILLTGLLLVAAGLSLNTRLLNGMILGLLYFMDRGGYYLRKQDYDRAVKEFNRVIERSPNKPGPYINRAIALMNLLELERAHRDVERALSRDANNPITWVLRGELLGKEKDYPAAFAAYNCALSLKPNWAIALLDRGSLHQETGSLHEALADMNLAVEHGHGAAVGYVLRSVLRYQMGDSTGSLEDAEQALRFAPHWMLVFPEIFLLSFEDHLDWAVEYYSRAVERMPSSYQGYQGRADAFRVNGQMDWAAADYSRAIELAPQNGELYYNRGRVYMHMGYPQKAAEDFRLAVQHTDRAHIRRLAAELLMTISSQTPAGAAPDPAGS